MPYGAIRGRSATASIAADPRYRVFVIAVDMAFSSSPGAFVAEQRSASHPAAAGQLPRRGSWAPRICYGFLTSRNSGQGPGAGAEEYSSLESQDPGPVAVVGHRHGRRRSRMQLRRLPARSAGDVAQSAGIAPTQTYTTLEELVQQLGSLRQERKNVVFVTNLPDARACRTAPCSTPTAASCRGPASPTAASRPASAIPVSMANDSYCAGGGPASRHDGLRHPLPSSCCRKRASRTSASTSITPGGLQAPVTIAGHRRPQTRDRRSDVARQRDRRPRDRQHQRPQRRA